MSYAIKVDPVEPEGHAAVLIPCPCGSATCRDMRWVSYPVPRADAAREGAAFRTYRVSLGISKAVAADRLGISIDVLEGLERGLARCDWTVARATLRFQARAVA